MRAWLQVGLVALALGTGVVAAQQEIIDVPQQLDFDEPEAWAMKWFASASLMTGLGPVQWLEPGETELGLELISLPHLDTEQRRVGFGGLKVEDLNRSPLSARLRATFGLPAGLAVTAGLSPPVTVDGVGATLVDLALERVVWRRQRDAVGLRLFGQLGEARGDLTCSEDDVRFEPGSPGNEFGCEERSSDEVTLDHVGLEVVGSHRFGGPRAPVLHAGTSVTYMDLEFQVDALTFGVRDRTLLLADGWTWSLTTGGTFTLGERLGASVEAFYSPLDVRRLPDRERENDGLLNLRALVRWKLR